MDTDITASVQKIMGFEPLKKVDPTTQEPLNIQITANSFLGLGQAAIPAVLVAIYKKATTAYGAHELLSITHSPNYLRVLFGAQTQEAIHAVAQYGKTSAYQAGKVMQQVAETAVQVLKTEIPNADAEAVSNFLSGQRSNILGYLPASLQMGKILDDSTMDDRTNKMDGPVSGLMHSIENIFAGTK